MSYPANADRSGGFPAILYAVLLIVLGLATLLGGARLVAVGGTFFYSIQGVLIVVSGVLVWR